jgi:phosphoglycolate phosphatase
MTRRSGFPFFGKCFSELRMTPAPTVVFDLDGTLVDTAPDLVATLNAIFAGEGLPPVPFEAARNMVGGGARALIERGLAAQGRIRLASDIDRLVSQFIDRYAAHIADQSRAFPGVEAALSELKRRGYWLAVCTNKLEWLSIRLLEALGLAHRFAAVCGADTFRVAKPDAAILRGTVERAGGRPDAAIMVGDSATDIQAARAAGIPVIAVDFGYSETPVIELGPDLIVSSFERLPEAVHCLLGPQKNRAHAKR